MHTALVAEHHIRPDDIRPCASPMPDDRMHIVDNGAMPDVCVQHLATLAVIDGTVTFAATP